MAVKVQAPEFGPRTFQQACGDDLDEDSTPARSNFTAPVTDSVTGAASTPTVSNVTVSGRTVTLTLDPAVQYGDSVALNYAKGTNPIQDTLGNAAAEVTDHPVTNDTARSMVNTLSLLDLNLNKSNMRPSFASDHTVYEVGVGYRIQGITVTAEPTDPRAAVSISPADADDTVDGHQVPLALGDNLVTLTVTPEDTTATAGVYTVTVTRQLRPALETATVNGTELVLTYDRDLDANSIPAAGNFSVNVTDSMTAASSTPAISNVAVDGTAVTLTLEPAVRYGDTVTVDYTMGANPIQDSDLGHKAFDLSGQAVTNDTAHSTDVTLNSLTLTAATLSPAFASGTAAYTATVANNITETTVTAIPTDPRASVSVTPADSDGSADGHQANLAEGQNVVTITVTAEDPTAAAGAYTVIVTRRPSVPGAPTGLSAAADSGQVTLSWTAPSDDGGSAITGYEYEVDGDGSWHSTGSTGTSHTVTGLTNGQSYSFKVRAVNTVGAAGRPDLHEGNSGVRGRFPGLPPGRSLPRAGGPHPQLRKAH